MAGELLNKLAYYPNVLTQNISNATNRARGLQSTDVLKGLKKTARKALPKSASPEAVDGFVKIVRPTVAGLTAGAAAGHAYEQGAKYLFGRGLRTADSQHAKKREFEEGSSVEKSYTMNDPQIAKDATDKTIRANNLKALKQDGAIGVGLKYLASYAGTFIGNAFYSDENKIDAVQNRFLVGASLLNAGLRTLLVSAPTLAAVLAGTAVGAGVSGLVGAYSLARAGLKKSAEIYKHARAKKAQAESQSDGSVNSDKNGKTDKPDAGEKAATGAVPPAKSPDADTTRTQIPRPKAKSTGGKHPASGVRTGGRKPAEKSPAAARARAAARREATTLFSNGHTAAARVTTSFKALRDLIANLPDDSHPLEQRQIALARLVGARATFADRLDALRSLGVTHVDQRNIQNNAGRFQIRAERSADAFARSVAQHAARATVTKADLSKIKISDHSPALKAAPQSARSDASSASSWETDDGDEAGDVQNR